MRVLFLYLLFACFLLQSLGRPQQTDYNNDNNVDEEEEDSEPAAEDTLADDRDEDAPLNDQEAAAQDEEAQYNRHAPEGRYMQRDAALEGHAKSANTDNFPDYKPNTNANDQIRLALKTRQSDKYSDSNDANDQQEAAQHLTNRDVNKANRAQNPRESEHFVNKRTMRFDRTFNEDGEMLFPNNKEQLSKTSKTEYNNNEAIDSNEQSRFLKQYYNTMQAENRGMVDDKSHDSSHYNLRDRRDTKELGQDVLNNPTLGKSANEDEEAAIKRHIKKLSGDELEQLLNSLTEEKRELLKKIINEGDPADNGFISKREITKKSGAVEINSFVESGQSDLSKVLSSAAVDMNSESSANQNSDTTEVSKQTEIRTELNDISSSKPAETSNGVELTNDEVTQKKSENNAFSSNSDAKSQAEISSNTQVSSKTENKRETNLDDLENMDISFDDSAFQDNDLNFKDGLDYSNDEGYFSPQDENSPQFVDEGTKYHNEDSKAYKREAYLEKQPDLTDSMKSLEESFPNSHAYDDSEPYSGPLIRVKRRNSDQIIKKRSAALLSDAKVAYFPYKAENDDEDNDEGNEFEDEGFYDSTSNFANNNKALDDDAPSNSDNSKQPQHSGNSDSKSSNDNPESDTMSLGSDTDSVLSGVEGVDDNLMYNSCSRNRRTSDDISSNDATLKSSKSVHSTSLTDDLMKTALENNVNLPHYQENDAFGALPRNYEGDLGRYKRIRRVKQSHKSDDPTSSNIMLE